LGKGFFVTGTGTGVGKTIVARALVRALVRRGISVRAIKPVESGVPLVDGAPRPEDALALARACGTSAKDAGGYRFAAPVSPHLAAAMEGTRIEPAPILELLSLSLDGIDVVIAEGAGGLLVPMNDDLLYGDLVARSGYSLVIVAPNALGAINSALTTVEAARARGMEVTGVILSMTAPIPLGNAEAIARHGAVRILGELPTVDTGDDDVLAGAAEASLDLTFLPGF